MRFPWTIGIPIRTRTDVLPPPSSRGLVSLLATGAGFSVAALYFNQPMLGAIGGELQATPRQLGLVPTMTQLGYGLGLALLAPLGNRFDRKKTFLAYLQRVGQRPAYRSAMFKDDPGLAPLLH